MKAAWMRALGAVLLAAAPLLGARAATTLVDDAAVYPEGPLWKDGRLLYVEYAGPGIKSWDGKRVYFTSSLLANWDKKGADDEQFLKGYSWDGKELKEDFVVDFHKEGLGRAHHMKFTARSQKAESN